MPECGIAGHASVRDNVLGIVLAGCNPARSIWTRGSEALGLATSLRSRAHYRGEDARLDALLGAVAA